MNTTTERIKAELRTLSREELAEITKFLLENAHESAEEAKEEFENELDRRIDAIRSGTVNGIPSEDVSAQIRRKYS
jgi:putative addiction module component (TIGR02574 family)